MSPTDGLRVDVEAISGIFGSVSIACWVVVFSPQIIENFKRSSTDGLSLTFLIIWLLGDVFNILGAILQGVLPTMLTLAIYYTLADIVLIGQCFYYRGLTFSNSSAKAEPQEEAQEDYDDESPLLSRTDSGPRYSAVDADRLARRDSADSYASDPLGTVDGTHLSPATPLHETSPAHSLLKPESGFYAFLFNMMALILVCGAGVFGWWISTRSYYGNHHAQSDNSNWLSVSQSAKSRDEVLKFDIFGQFFGYLCAVFYLGSRLPQLLLNYRRKSTEGVSMLFFLFACVGNLTYVLSIFAYEPACVKQSGSNFTAVGCEPGQWNYLYSRYILINLSWLIGSAGTLALDVAIFAQFWKYRGNSPTTNS